MAMFIVSYRKDAEGVCSTNIAVAENREQVEAKYGECDFIAINPAKSYEVEELRQRGCPVTVCGGEDKAAKGKRMLDRLIGKIEDMEWDCDEEIYDALLKIQYAMA